MSGPFVNRGVMEYECEHGQSSCVVITVVLLFVINISKVFGPLAVTFPKTIQHSYQKEV